MNMLLERTEYPLNSFFFFYAQAYFKLLRCFDLRRITAYSNAVGKGLKVTTRRIAGMYYYYYVEMTYF